MNPFYSVEAMISSNGKNYKGTLDFYDDKCILHNATRVFDEFSYTLDTAEFETGITSVLFLGLYTKEKPYIRIRHLSKANRLHRYIRNFQNCLIHFLCYKRTMNAHVR